MYITYKVNMYLKPKQYAALDELCEVQRNIFNLALTERNANYYRSKALVALGQDALEPISYRDQAKWLSTLAQEYPELGKQYSSSVRRGPLVKLAAAYKSFFKLRKARPSMNPRPPGRIEPGEWTTLTLPDFHGANLKGNKLRVKGIPGLIRLNPHRPLPPSSQLCIVEFSKTGNRWKAHLVFDVECVPEKDIYSDAVVIGIDKGISTLVTCSDETTYENIRPYESAQRELRLLDRKLARAKKGSRNRKDVKEKRAKLLRRVASIRNTHLHQISADLTNRSDVVVMEDLNVRGLARGILSKQVHDSAFAKLANQIEYKGVLKGKTVQRVDPAYTSQICSGCGTLVPKTLSDRVHNCHNCGLTLDRDLNAAKVIAQQGVQALSERKTILSGRENRNVISAEDISALENSHTLSGKTKPDQEVTTTEVE